MLQNIPHYIYSRRNQTIMVLFVPLFCMAFIFLYHPHDFDTIDERFFSWAPFNPDTSWHIAIGVMVLIGMAVAAINRLLMSLYARRRELTFIAYILWVIGEIMAMTLIYSGVSSLVSEKPFFEIYNLAFFKTVRTLLIPYVLCYLYFIWEHRSHEYKTIKQQLEDDETTLMKAYVQLFDERGKMHLSIRCEDLLFAESADNYVCVWYLHNNTPKKFMLRNNLKNLTTMLQDTHVVRCHRSYMVNMDHVKILKREKEGIFLELGVENVPDIPLSKTYTQSVNTWLMSGKINN